MLLPRKEEMFFNQINLTNFWRENKYNHTLS